MKKSLKKQAVFPVLMLLVVTALALIGSSFAWFSMSSTATVTGIGGTVEDSSIGLMISEDALNFKGSIALSNQAATYVKPYRFHQISSTNGYKFYEAEIVQKAADGTATSVYSTASACDPIANGDGKLAGWYIDGESATQTLASGADSASTFTNKAGYMVFDLFFEVEKASDLYLNFGTTFSANSTGLNSNYDNKAMRVAFLSLGGVETGANTAAQLQTAAIALDPETPVKTTIWNPNTTSAETAQYYGVSSASTSQNPFTPYTSSSHTTLVQALHNDKLFSSSAAFDSQSDMTGYTSIASLVAGVNKVRVVIWLEGNDASCTTKVANLVIQAQLNFFAKATTNNSGN